MTTAIPKRGDLYDFTWITGYTPAQHRRYARDCRDDRHGHSHPEIKLNTQKGYWAQCPVQAAEYKVHHETLEVTEVIYWADNSIEVVGTKPDGTKRRQTLVAPHGDLC